MLKLCALIAIPVVAIVAAEPEKENADRKAITQTALDYCESWYAGDAKRMENVLHPDLAKRVLNAHPRTGKGKIDHMSAMTLVQATRRGNGTKTPTDQQQKDVYILDVYGNAASVKAVMGKWIDYMHMSKIGGRWVIVNVLWEYKPETKKQWGIPEEL